MTSAAGSISGTRVKKTGVLQLIPFAELENRLCIDNVLAIVDFADMMGCIFCLSFRKKNNGSSFCKE